MSEKIRVYEGEKIDVAYDLKRCIHASECVTRLRAVFDTAKRPWIQPNNATPDEIAEVIHHCPSGALHYTRKDGGAAEAPDAANTIHLEPHGPLNVRGNIVLLDGAGNEVKRDTRMTLCRCGASKNKPFCDNTHLDIDFHADVKLDRPAVEPAADGGEIFVKPNPNDSYTIRGQFTVYDETGKPIYSGEKQWFCRCGGSGDKPFCDGTHKRNGFTTEPPPVAENPTA